MLTERKANAVRGAQVKVWGPHFTTRLRPGGGGSISWGPRNFMIPSPNVNPRLARGGSGSETMLCARSAHEDWAAGARPGRARKIRRWIAKQLSPLVLASLRTRISSGQRKRCWIPTSMAGSFLWRAEEPRYTATTRRWGQVYMNAKSLARKAVPNTTVKPLGQTFSDRLQYLTVLE